MNAKNMNKNKNNTFIDKMFKLSIFVFIFSLAFSTFLSIRNIENVAFAVVLDDVVSPECQVPQITSPLSIVTEVTDINSPSNSNIVYEIKTNRDGLDTLSYGVNGALPLGMSLFQNVIYGNPAEGTHSIEFYAQNNCGKDTKTLNITISEIEQPVVVIPNTAPVITLNGSSTIEIYKGQNFVDPKATATDKEDGNITNKIVVTGTVDTTKLGKYTLTYKVTDNGGLSASVTRDVLVFGEPYIDLSCKITDSNQKGFYGTYFNYRQNSLGMELPTSEWNKSYGDPLSKVSTFTANWYQNSFARFSRVDSNLNFGANFFPFNSYPEELTNNKEHYFGVLWEAKVFATTTGSYDFVLTSDDDSWVYVNGVLVANNSGVHGATTINGTANLNKGENLVQIFFAERHTIESHMNFAFQNTSLDVRPYSDKCNPAPTNTPPTITLVGSNPATTTVGTPFTDPGATATDKEDGNITNKIVVTGTVDYNTVGEYTLTYTVTDTGGLSASTTRKVVVEKKPTVPPVTPSTVTINVIAKKIVCDVESDLPNWGLGGPNISSTTASEFVASHPNCHLESGWKFQWASATTTDPGKTFVGEASGWTTFGPTTQNGVASTTITLATSTSYIWVREVLKDGYIPFTYPNNNENNVSAEMYCHIDVLNYDNYDRVDGPLVNNKHYYCIAFNALKTVTPPTNTPPTITLVGSNPATTTVGTPFTDPGATATDKEDGNITNKIVVTGTVDYNTVGEYTLTYTVTDTGGLSASTTRKVVVEKVVVPVNRKINACIILVDENNNIATSSYNLPSGKFSINLSKEGSNSTTTLTWDSSTFSPDRKTILGVNDSDCQDISNLDIGNYIYSEMATTGPAWKFGIKYNDQSSQPVNNVFDFFPYKSGNPLNDNSDGLITINEVRPERTLVVLVAFDSKHATNTPPTITLVGSNPISITIGTPFTDPGATATDKEDGNITNKIVVTGTVSTTTVGTYTLTYTVTDSGGLTASTTRDVIVTTGGGPQCLLPDITSPLTAEVQVNSSFSYTLTASSTATTTLNVATSTLPAGLTYSNGVISGVPTAVGTYNITLEASNSCGTTTKTLVLTVKEVPPPVCVGCGGGSGGGGGGGGGNGPIIQSLTIFNEYVQEIEPGVAMVTWNTNLPATREVVYGNSSQTNLGLAPLYGYTNNTEKISTPLSTTHSMVIPIDKDKVYYFRPISSDNSRTVVGKELNITRGQAPVGGSCFYLYDFLRKDFNNNPVEVRKLQVFLRDLEGFTDLQVTGVYDDQTIVALNAFQDRYAGDILTPWGHEAPTGYTYILTKKKVNEIYCQRAFPVTPLEQQEIDSFRAFLESLRRAGVTVENNIPTPPSSSSPVEIQNQIIGSTAGTETNTTVVGTSTITTLAGVTGTTQNIITNLTANVLQSGRNLLNYVLGWFGFPASSVLENDYSSRKSWYINWVVVIVILAVIASLYLWYKEHKKNKEEEIELKKIEELNKEIDLK